MVLISRLSREGWLGDYITIPFAVSLVLAFYFRARWFWVAYDPDQIDPPNPPVYPDTL